jgi:hypothetical protein
MNQQEMEQVWAEHIRHEFVTKDVEATLATWWTTFVNHVPVNTVEDAVAFCGRLSALATITNDDLLNRVFGQIISQG